MAQLNADPLDGRAGVFVESGYHALALVVLAVHGAFVAWVFAGGFIARRSRQTFALHMLSVLWGLMAVVIGFSCPLTRLENHFRELGGLSTYAEECIPHYIWIPLGLPDGPFSELILVLPAVLLNYLAYRPRGRVTAG